MGYIRQWTNELGGNLDARPPGTERLVTPLLSRANFFFSFFCHRRPQRVFLHFYVFFTIELSMLSGSSWVFLLINWAKFSFFTRQVGEVFLFTNQVGEVFYFGYQMERP